MKRLFQIIIFALAVGILVCPALAQIQMPAKITHYSTEEGLSHDIISTIYKDHEGYMWFGTWGGLNRFDGTRFRSFRSVANDSSQIANNRIDHISEDNEGQLWVKAYDSQIYRFSKVTEQFRSLAVILGMRDRPSFDQVLFAGNNELWIGVNNGGIIHVPDISKKPDSYHWFKQNGSSRERISSNKINCFLRDRDSDVWLGTAAGLVHLTHDHLGNYFCAISGNDLNVKQTIKTIAETRGKIVAGSNEGQLLIYDRGKKTAGNIRVSHNQLNQILVSRNQSKLYITTNGGELIVFDLLKNSFRTYTNSDKSPFFTMFEDKRGSIWIEPEHRGVVRFDVRGYFETYSQRNDSKNISAGNHFKVFEDNNGVVWSVLRDGGFGYYDYSNNTFNYFHNEPDAKDHLFSNLVTVAFYDASGVMWLHTDEHGLEKIIFQPQGFQRKLVDESAVFQSDNEIRGLCVDRMNRAWVCAKGGKIYWIEQGILSPANLVGIDGKKLGAVYAIKEDHLGNVWLGTKTQGLYEAIPTDASHRTYRLVNFAHDVKNENSISSNQIYAISEDARRRIWIGTFDSGLNLLQVNNGAVSFTRINGAKYHYPKGLEKIRTIENDLTGRLWLGTTEGLVVMKEMREGFKFQVYNKQAGERNSLGNNDIQFIHRDHSGNMWLGTSGGGLDMAIEESAGKFHFVNYTTKQGLTNDYVLSFAEDNANQFWIATKGSLARFNLVTKAIKNFTSFDGLPNAGFSEATCQNTLDGKLIFGTIHGYLMFDPRRISPHPVSANLVFTGLRVNNDQILAGDTTGILKKSINYSTELTLKHDQNVISLEYALLDYRFESNLPFMYRLKGFDTEWHDNTNQQRATYTNIPAGHYVFEIKCADSERYKNIPFKSLEIAVLPAPWLSWWAYLIYALIAISILAIIWRSLFTALKLRHQIAVEHQLTELKLNFFTNISHELRTPLMLILNPIAQLIKSGNFDQRQSQYLEIVNRNAGRMVRFVNQLLEFRKVQHGKGFISLVPIEMTRFLKEISEHFEDIRREKNIELIFEGFEKNIEVLLDQDKVETVIYNLLSNAYKFTPVGKTITVRLSHNPGLKELILVISDEGKGVPESELELIFELYHSEKRTSLTSEKGTGIGLALSKELITLHGGKITAANNDEGGLSVMVILPYQEPGAVGHTLNPIDQPEFEDMQQQEKHHTNAHQSKKDAPLLVLVEDNPDMREFLKMQLSEIYRVVTTGDGLEGLKMIRSLMPDIVLSDVMMPVMDGIELIDQLKNDGAVSHIPVVLMSARNSVEHQIIGLNYGADYYLGKPFKNELLIAAISNILEQRKKLFQKLSGDKKVIHLNPSDIIVTSKDEIFLKNVLKIMDENMANPDFDIEKVSHLLNMGRANFYKKFKSLTQVAPVEFVRDMRLQRAKQYFDAGGGNVAEIAYTVGFSSPKYFSTCFRTKYKISPSEYLRANKPTVGDESQHHQ